MPSVIFEIKDQVACISLNRPEKLNAFNRDMTLLLREKLDACAAKEIRCVYITGMGKSFSAGQDLEAVTGSGAAGFKTILSEQYNPIILRIRNLQKPVLAAVNGVAAGAGANIALCCDVVVAAASASFIQAFSKIGLVPDSGGSYFLPRLVGFQKAAALMMLGEKIMATEAERIGMIYRCLPDETFATESMAIARALSQMPTKALAGIKMALQASAGNSLPAQLALEDELQQKAAATADYSEGIQAFLEKRRPVFKGE